MIITKEQYLQLVGLLTLAYNHHDRILEIEDTIVNLLNGKDNHDIRDWVGESVWSEKYTPRQLLDYIKIEVVD